MTVSIKSPNELEMMRAAGRVVGNTLQQLREVIEPGVTTEELDRLTEASIRQQGAEPAFPRINNFPGSACISINEEVVHGIPGPRKLRSGDIVKLDVGAIYQGLHGDAAITVGVGKISEEARRLVEITEGGLAAGIDAARQDGYLYDIGEAIQDFVEPRGFSMVRQYFGHGIGRQLHEDPTVPHFRQPHRGMKLRDGMTFTIEPMVNAGTYETMVMSDGWTVITKDKRLSAQFEHTIAIRGNGVEILTLPEKGEAWGLPYQAQKAVQ